MSTRIYLKKNRKIDLHVFLVAFESRSVGPGEIASRSASIVEHFRGRIEDVRSRYEQTGYPDTQGDADGGHLAHTRSQRVHYGHISIKNEK